MKKNILLAVISVALVIPAFADTFGVGLVLDVNNSSYKMESGSTSPEASNNAYEIGAKLYYFMDSGMDVFGGLSYYNHTYKDEDYAFSVTDDLTNSNVNIFGGVNKVMVSSGPFSAGLGGQVYVSIVLVPTGYDADSFDDFLDLLFGITLPASFDINYTENFLTRVRFNLISVSTEFNSYSYEGSTIDHSDNDFDVHVGNTFGIDFVYRF